LSSVRGVALLAVVAAVAVAGCGDSPGLRPLTAQHVGFLVHCGATVYWDAGAVANDARQDAIVRSAHLLSRSDLALSGVRARIAPVQSVAGADARTPGIGLRVPPTSKTPARAWHLILLLKAPNCALGSAARMLALPAHAVELAYDLDGRHRKVVMGEQLEVCAKRGRARCRF
jgi:hypothetical protein